MHRKELIQLLENYAPTNGQEIAYKQLILDFITHHPDCFDRSCEIGHITGSAWLLNKDHSKVLLMHHVKLNKWFQLGGHCDANSDVLAVAIKEAQEESGIEHIEPVKTGIYDIDIHLIPAKGNIKAHYHYDVRFLLHVTSDEQVVQNHESRELRWIGKNRSELPTDNPSVVRMFEKWAS